MDPINRRSLIAGLGATGLAVGLGRGSALAQGNPAKAAHLDDYTALEQECIEACSDCEKECLAAIQHCLKKGGEHVAAEHMGTLASCAEICALAAKFMLGRSEFDKKLCALCAELCDRCAESCEKFKDDPRMQQCAKTCRDCADVCRRFVQS